MHEQPLSTPPSAAQRGMPTTRVLHVIGVMDRGGAETFIMNVYRSIDRRKIQFDFLVNEEYEADYNEEIRGLGGNIYYVPRFVGSNLFSFLRNCDLFFSKHHDYSAVHIHIGSSAAFIILTAKKYGLFTIAHSHNCHFPLSPLELAFRTISYPTRFLASYFFACSMQAGIDRFGHSVVNGSRFAVINNGIQVQRYTFSESLRSHVRLELGIADTVPVLLHVGRLIPEKNHAFLFDVFSRLKRTLPDAVLLLAGRGPLENELKDLANELEISASIHFLGIREDIPNLLCAADVFVFPSVSEGLPLSVIEAQASGLPCITSTGLPQDAIVTDRAERIPLSDGTGRWAEIIINAYNSRSKKTRPAYPAIVANKGFDIEKTADCLTKFYLCPENGYTFYPEAFQGKH